MARQDLNLRIPIPQMPQNRVLPVDGCIFLASSVDLNEISVRCAVDVI